MGGKVCVVTGANSGLGFEVARGLAAREATVHMLCRNAERGEEARTAITDEHGNTDVHVHVVDLSRLTSIRRFAEAFAVLRLDVLVHNAGLLPLKRELTADGTIGFIMPDRLTHSNLQANGHAAYLFRQEPETDSGSYKGVRLYLKKVAEDEDQERIAKLRRRVYGDDRDGRYLVIFSIEKELPLVGAA